MRVLMWFFASVLVLAGVWIASFFVFSREMGATEYGVLFVNMPPQLGGGIKREVILPGQRAIVWPWESVYRLDTRETDVVFGSAESSSRVADDSFVYTRALDGNEVALDVTLTYRLAPDPARLVSMVESVAVSNDEAHELISSAARADIRTFMNELKTADFIDDRTRYEKVDKVRDNLNSRLSPLGLEVLRVKLSRFRFENLQHDGSVDDSYQRNLDEIKKIEEDTERELARVDTVRATKEQEYNVAQGEYRRLLEEAKGYERQAQLRGDAYLQAKENKAEAILAKGKAEVDGLIEKVNALSGPGGPEIVKLDIARALMERDPKFVVMGETKGGQGIDVQRLDTNTLLEQLGVSEPIRSETAPGQSDVAIAVPAPVVESEVAGVN